MGSPIHWVAPEKSFVGARYEINQIGRASGIENWLPSLDTFRTFAVCPPQAVREVFWWIQSLAAA
jgi:hypothetical protein